ncbi:MAG: aconitase X catalytic domain-containing protein [Deltaproteobacteria bacterium]|nr:aconitase X catalytic domain-containing protein [Deltaproteobacteria bacterium]
MELTKKEDKILNGHEGDAKQKAMELLIRIGELYDAKRLIRISRAHVLASLINFHDAGIQVVEGFSNAGGKYCVPTTIDPVSMSMEGCDIKLPKDLITKQQRIMKAHQQMGVIPSWTCTPYLYENVPAFGEHIAWAESSAVIFANSILGARTNRMSTGLDVAAALVGKIPEFGLHLDQNRKPDVRVKINIEALNDLDYHTLGLLLGKLTRGKIPLIQGIPPDVTVDQLKNLGSGLAMTGGLALFHVEGVTPEVKYGYLKPSVGSFSETFEILRSDLDTMQSELTTTDEGIDLVVLGCPLYSIEQVKTVALKTTGRRISADMEFWIHTSPYVKWMCERQGYAKPIRKAGIKLLSGTCIVISFVKLTNIRRVMLDSARAAHLVPSEHNLDVVYASTEDCIETALQGC